MHDEADLDGHHASVTGNGVHTPRTNDGMERGSLVARTASAPELVTSISTKIANFYAALPEVDKAEPCVDPTHAEAATVFNTPVMKMLLHFVVTCGGAGLAEPDQEKLAELLLRFVPTKEADVHGTGLHSVFGTPYGLVAAVREEQRRVLAVRAWHKVAITVGSGTHTFFFRDVLKCATDALCSADDVELVGQRMEPDANGNARRSYTMNSDLFLQEQADVVRIHGAEARVLGTVLHADEAVISWNGGNYVYPLRAQFVNVRDGGGVWTTVGYIPHIPKVVGDGKSTRARRVVSDSRNDLVQRCLAMALRSFMHASENGVTVELPGVGRVTFVPRIVGLVVDQVEERGLLGLMGHASTFNCSHCLVRRTEACDIDGCVAAERPVISTLQAQLEAAEARIETGRPRTRVALARTMSALPFVPFLGAIHGLGTGAANLYRIVSFDTLHVWKLGVLRLMAKRLPKMLETACGNDAAIYGSVSQTLHAVNMRAFELGRLCRAAPVSPG